MTQEQLIKEFIAGANEGNNDGKHNLVIKNGQLVHYYTLIAERAGGKFIVNMTRYSIVTGRIQKMLHENIPNDRLIIAVKVPEGTRKTLVPYIKLE